MASISSTNLAKMDLEALCVAAAYYLGEVDPLESIDWHAVADPRWYRYRYWFWWLQGIEPPPGTAPPHIRVCSTSGSWRDAQYLLNGVEAAASITADNELTFETRMRNAFAVL